MDDHSPPNKVNVLNATEFFTLLQIEYALSTHYICKIYVIVVQSLSYVWLFATPWTAAHQASLSFTVSQSLLRLMSIELVMPSNHLILCCLLLLLPSVLPNIRVFSNESVLRIRWPKWWSFNFSIGPSNGIFRTDCLLDGLAGSPCCPSDYQESSNTTIDVQKHQFFSTQLSL